MLVMPSSSPAPPPPPPPEPTSDPKPKKQRVVKKLKLTPEEMRLEEAKAYQRRQLMSQEVQVRDEMESLEWSTPFACTRLVTQATDHANLLGIPPEDCFGYQDWFKEKEDRPYSDQQYLTFITRQDLIRRRIRVTAPFPGVIVPPVEEGWQALKPIPPLVVQAITEKENYPRTRLMNQAIMKGVAFRNDWMSKHIFAIEHDHTNEVNSCPYNYPSILHRMADQDPLNSEALEFIYAKSRAFPKNIDPTQDPFIYPYPHITQMVDNRNYSDTELVAFCVLSRNLFKNHRVLYCKVYLELFHHFRYISTENHKQVLQEIRKRYMQALADWGYTKDPGGQSPCYHLFKNAPWVWTKEEHDRRAESIQLAPEDDIF